MDISFNINIHENLMYYHRNLRDYNDNFHEYNQNMSNYLSLLTYQTTYQNTQQATQPAISNAQRRPVRQSNRNTLNSLLNNYINNRNYHNRNLVNDFVYNYDSVVYDPVVVRPNNAQIHNATEHIQYTNGLSQNACPITLETFQEGEQVCRIIHCGHIFKEIALNEWFQRNVRCPICRYDIRTYTGPQERQEHQHQDPIENTNEESEFDDAIRELNQELNQELNNTRTNLSRHQPSHPETSSRPSSSTSSMFIDSIRTFINNELQYIPINNDFTELIYAFDIPIDISRNRYRI